MVWGVVPAALAVALPPKPDRQREAKTATPKRPDLFKNIYTSRASGILTAEPIIYFISAPDARPHAQKFFYIR
jgi:hypothetical protein